VEAFLTKLLSTLSAEEVFRMPSFLKGSHAFLKSKKTNFKYDTIKLAQLVTFQKPLGSWQ